MKTIRTLLTAILTFVAVSLSTQASAQTPNLTLEQKKEVISMLKQQLPMEAGEGITWTAINMDWSKYIIKLRFEIDPKGIGLTLKEAKYGFSSLSSNEVRELVGKEFIDSMKMIGAKKVILTLVFPDKTSTSYEITC